MTKSDRERLAEAISRYQAKYDAIDRDISAPPEVQLAAAVDWLRALAKLARRFFPDDATNDGDTDSWVWEHIMPACSAVTHQARKLGDEIREEMVKS